MSSKINYNIRAAKSVERKMFLDSLKEHFKHQNLNKVRYVGFGSYYFTDFKLFHRELGINKMVSYEMDAKLEKRVKFNKPFKCIEISIGKSTDLLPYLDWSANLTDVIWLDYVGTINTDMFVDCEVVFSNLTPGSIYLITCNRQLNENVFHGGITEVRTTFTDLVPIAASEKSLTGDGSNDVKLIRQMFLNQIEKTLSTRNAGLIKSEKLVFHPIYLFTYRDGAPMMSFGGVIEKQGAGIKHINDMVKKFSFLTKGNNPYNIDPPNLTYKEVHSLNAKLPSSSKNFASQKQIDFISKPDLAKYRELYKYLPTYMDVVY